MCSADWEELMKITRFGRSKRIAVAMMAVIMLMSVMLQGCASKSGSAAENESDTIRWINASYAILTELNGWDYTMFPGVKTTELNKQIQIASLEQWWDVTDRQSADETLEWALSEGHRTGFVEDAIYLEDMGFGEVPADERIAWEMEYYGLDEDDAWFFAQTYGFYEEYGEHAIDGWDYCRALNLLSFYYIAGYYTKEEALDKSLEIARTVQPMFDSWDDLVDSYLRGYEYWAEESSDERREVYEDLKSRSDNPYAVDYHTTLEKTW